MPLKELEPKLTIFLQAVPVGVNLKDLLAAGVEVSNPMIFFSRQTRNKECGIPKLETKDIDYASSNDIQRCAQILQDTKT